MKFRVSLFAILLAVGLVGCEKDGSISVIPEIAFVSIDPVSAQQFDAVEIVISYQDGDGDLGENVAGVDNLFVTDLRNGVIYAYRIQELAPQGSTIAIQGNLNVQINSVSVIDPMATAEQVQYSVYVVDRAGNQSNVVTTDEITVTK